MTPNQPITRQDLAEAIAAAVAELKANQDRTVESLVTSMTDLHTELTGRMDTLERRFDTLTPVIFSLDTRMAAFTRGVDQLITANGQTAGTFAAQQRAIDQLAAEVAELKRRLDRRQS